VRKIRAEKRRGEKEDGRGEGPGQIGEKGKGERKAGGEFRGEGTEKTAASNQKEL